MNIKVFIRSPLLILVFLCFMALGCDNPPHTIKATTSLGAEYKAPHIVVGIGTADSEHQYWPETSRLSAAVMNLRLRR